MRRHLFTVLSALSLLLCATAVSLWVLSYRGQKTGTISIDSHALATRWELHNTPGDLFAAWMPIQQTAEGAWVPTERSSLESLAFGFGFFADGRSGELAVPHWFLVLLSLALGIPFFLHYLRARARRRKGRCPRCGYDLRATPGRCPECGTPAAAKGEA